MRKRLLCLLKMLGAMRRHRGWDNLGRCDVLERIGIAVLVGVFGFFIGMSVWWVCSYSIPAFNLRTFLPLSLLLGAVCFFVGLWRPNATIDVLGFIGEKAWSFSREVLSWFQFFR